MAGFYGKLPSKGDFLTRGLQRRVVDNLHEFFHQGLQESKVKLGNDWLEYYAIAPIWHFYFPKGTLDDQNWLGIWLPSVDSVNRSFPLILLDTIEQPITDLSEFNAYFDWFTECENLMLDVVHEDIEFDNFCSQVATKSCYQKFHKSDDIDAIFEELEPVKPAAIKEVNIDHLSPSTPFEKALLSKIGMLEHIASALCEKQGIAYQQLVNDFIGNLSPDQKDSSVNVSQAKSFDFNINLAESSELISRHLTEDEFANCCLWSTEGNEKVARQTIFHQQLPQADQFYKFLQGF